MMTTLALTSPLPGVRVPGLLHELLRRQRALALFGLIAMLLSLPAMLLQQLDPRMLHGVGVWDKPMKFFVATGLFSVTAAWFFGYVRPENRDRRLLRRTAVVLIASGGFELVWITWQAAFGLDSHFNMSTPFYTSMFALMGVFALLLVGSSLPLAWEIGRRPAAGLRPEFVAAVVTGLVLSSVFGATTGFTMAGHMSHSVGMEGGHLAPFGWNRRGGDLRVAHFLGLHAEQALPILGLLVGLLDSRWRRPALALGTLLYVMLTVAVFVQAVLGHPLLPL